MKHYSTHMAVFFLLLFTVHSRTVGQIAYPYPVAKISLQVENQQVQMAYMDIQPVSGANGKNILLLHGKNFNGYYWKDVAAFLSQMGYRVIVPDQLGWGKSDHPNLHYSFHLMAATTKALLDTLGIDRITVAGHSMGGMMAIRFVLMYPRLAEKLVLENPIGLEDYKTFVPYQPLEKLYGKEKTATYESYKKYQESYYPHWKREYEQYVEAQAADLQSTEFNEIAWSNAVTYQMIYEQPVVYELSRITIATLLIIGQADRTIVGKDQLTESEKKLHGQYPVLGKRAQQQIRNSQLKELPGIGHIPHIQDISLFKKALTDFLKK